MINPNRLALPLFILISLFLASACKRDSGPPPPLPAEQIPAELKKGFADASATTRELSAQVASAVQSSNYVAAFSAAQALCARPDLKKKQQILAGRALLTVNELLQAAQARGDQDAAAAIQIHRSTR